MQFILLMIIVLLGLMFIVDPEGLRELLIENLGSFSEYLSGLLNK